MELELDLDFTPRQITVAKKTPTEIKKIASCRVTYDDGSELEIPVENDQGFHRINETTRDGRAIICHEIFISYGRYD